MSSAIKSVAMNPVHGYIIGVDKFLKRKDNLRVAEHDVFYQTTCVEDGRGGYFFMGVPHDSGPGTIVYMNRCLFAKK